MRGREGVACGRDRLALRIKTGLAALRLLYQIDRAAFLIATSTGVIESLFYPLLLLLVWRGLGLLVAGGGSGHDLSHEGILLLTGLFAVLALQHLLRIANETATTILQAESAQHVNGRIMSKMTEVPYRLFEDNQFQARYGLLISQASYRPAMLVQTLTSTVSALVASLAMAVTLFALAPLLIVFLPVLVPLTIVEARFHGRTLELQTDSASDLFRMMHLSQKSIDATWQRDLRVHNSTILDEEYRMLAQRYLGNLTRLLRHYQAIRVGVGIGVAAVITVATAAVFWLINRGPNGLTEAAVLLPALYFGLTEGKIFATSWGSLIECLGYITQVLDFLNQSVEGRDLGPARPATAARGH